MEKRGFFKFIDSRSVFLISLLVLGLTVLSVWLFGLDQGRTMLENAKLSMTIISASFFTFISFGLYRGYKLRDSLGRIADSFDLKKVGEVAGNFASNGTDISVDSDDFFLD